MIGLEKLETCENIKMVLGLFSYSLALYLNNVNIQQGSTLTQEIRKEK